MDLKLPRMCVIGDQSSGKSSILSSISGLKFPEASKTCTKCAIVVNLRKSDKLSLKINDGEPIISDNDQSGKTF